MKGKSLININYKMCYKCKVKPVYEFTNKRKLCKRCFINWFQKKVLYTIRKFGMIKRNDIIGYRKGNNFRDIVLEDILKIFSEKSGIEIIKINSKTAKIGKTAVPITSDSTAYFIVNKLVKHKIRNLKETAPVNKNLIKPLYLFLDKEVLLYAKLRKLKYKKINETLPGVPQNAECQGKDKITQFVDELEKKHPEVKRAVVNSWLDLEI